MGMTFFRAVQMRKLYIYISLYSVRLLSSRNVVHVIMSDYVSPQYLRGAFTGF